MRRLLATAVLLLPLGCAHFYLDLSPPGGPVVNVGVDLCAMLRAVGLSKHFPMCLTGMALKPEWGSGCDTSRSPWQ